MTTEVMARIASDVMGHPPIKVSVDTSLAIAARTMIERRALGANRDLRV